GAVRVRALDPDGAPARGATIVWLATGSTASPSTSRTDAAGVATTSWVMGTHFCGAELRANAAGGVAHEVVFRAGPPSSGPDTLVLGVYNQDARIVAGNTITIHAPAFTRCGQPWYAPVRFTSSDTSVATLDSIPGSVNFAQLHL